MIAATAPSTPIFKALEWDSGHYGMSVGRIVGDVGSSQDLKNALTQAMCAGARLVYYLHLQPFALDTGLLDRFGGLRVGGHVKYSRKIDHTTSVTTGQSGLALNVYEGPADNPQMLALGVDAGVLSRFRTDQRLPVEKCDELYSIWIERSIRRELADEVLVAQMHGVLCGLITYSIKSDTCEIGLVSTAESSRGMGVATTLLAYAHQRMVARGRYRSEVVTQTENTVACRLYERAGYSEEQRGDYFHFLLPDQQNIRI